TAARGGGGWGWAAAPRQGWTGGGPTRSATPDRVGPAHRGRPRSVRERVEGAWGNRKVPPHRQEEGGKVGETWFPPRERAEGERRSCGTRELRWQAASWSPASCSSRGRTTQASKTESQRGAKGTP